MKNVKYLLEKHAYAPELNKLYIIRKGKKIEFKLNGEHTRKMQYLKNHDDIVKYVRTRIFKKLEYNNKLYIDLKLENSLVSEFDAFQPRTIKGFIDFQKDNINLLNLIRDYKKVNHGLQSIIIGFTEDKKPIYKEFNNIVTLKINKIS